MRQMETTKSQNIEATNQYIVFSVNGGIGKNILATTVINAISKQYPKYKLLVISGYPEVFLNNPNIYRIFRTGNTPYFKEDYIKDDTKIFQIDPYHTQEFVHKKKHLIDTWCELCGVKVVDHNPRIFLTPREREFIKNKYSRQKPIFVIQTNGGPSNNNIKTSWARDIPLSIAQKVVDEMSKTHHVFHIRRNDQLPLNNVEWASAPLRELFGLIELSDKRLFNDSFGMHCAKAFEKPSTVCWIGTDPNIYGYDIHSNIFPQGEKIFTHGVDKYLEETPWNGDKMYECPYEIDNLFSVTGILKSLRGYK